MNILRLLTFFRLGENAEAPEVAMAAIERNVVFKGTNLMILVFAILIASVGLNVNSAAVIIGAMLISPLMGPIIGVGAGLAVHDLYLVRRAMKNLGFAVGASVVTSTLYFLITPLDDAHSEILARTSPTIWDVLIALSGGFAGMIAAASKDRGNVVPGVAIATALMPPLCTAGYGLAHANWAFFAGAFYLFLINSVFIALATLATIRWLKFPKHHYADEALTKRLKTYTTLIVLITTLPSIYLAWRLVQQNTFSQRAQRFISNECSIPGNFLVDQQVDLAARRITLTYMGDGPKPEQEVFLRERLAVYDIQGTELELKAGLVLGAERDGSQRIEDEHRILLARSSAIQDSLAQREEMRAGLIREAQAIDPDLLWLVALELPGRPESLPQVVSAHFTTQPDTVQVSRLQRWLTSKITNGVVKLVISVEAYNETGGPVDAQ